MNDTDERALREAYARRFESVLRPLATTIEAHLRDQVAGQPRVDTV